MLNVKVLKRNFKFLIIYLSSFRCTAFENGYFRKIDNRTWNQQNVKFLLVLWIFLNKNLKIAVLYFTVKVSSSSGKLFFYEIIFVKWENFPRETKVFIHVLSFDGSKNLLFRL